MVIQCKTLLGQKNLDFSIACLGSFVEYAEDDIQLIIFEDGSLTPDGKQKLSLSLKNCIIDSKGDRDAVVNMKLKSYPKCYHYRNSILYAHKIFDVMLYDEKDLLFIDSDVLFLKRFKLPSFNQFPVFIADKHHAYSFSPAEFFNVSYPIFPHVNTGFFYFPYNQFDVALIESLLNDAVIGKGLGRISWLEQTIWAFLAARNKKVGYFDSKQIVMAQKVLTKDIQRVAVHLVSSYRSHFNELYAQPAAANSKVESIKINEVSTYLGKAEFLLNRLKKKLYRHIGLDM